MRIKIADTSGRRKCYVILQETKWKVLKYVKKTSEYILVLIFMIWFSGNSELQVPQDSDIKSCFSIQKLFACVHEYFPVYTSVHFPDHEMEQLCMHTVTRKFYLESGLFSSQCVYPMSNINIYFLLIRSGGRYSGGWILAISSVVALYQKVSWTQAPF